MKFAKLYETEQFGQILVKIDSSNDDMESVPEVRIYFEPENLGVCSQAVKFENSDEGWDKAEARFLEITEEKAINLVKILNDEIFSVITEGC